MKHVSLAIELVKDKVTHFDQRLVSLSLIFSKCSSTVTYYKGKIVDKLSSLKKQRLSKISRKWQSDWIQISKYSNERGMLSPHVPLSALHMP